MIIPFAFLFLFNHPSGDDFGLAVNTKLFGFLEAQRNYYYTWTGKYFSNAVLSVSPLYFSSIAGYKLFSFLIMILFFCFLYLMIKEISGGSTGVNENILLSLSIFFLYMYSMPSVSQSFYWLTASVVYQLGIIFVLLFVIMFLKSESESNKSLKLFYIISAVIALAAAVGSSEMAMVVSALVIGFMVIRNLLCYKKVNFLLVVIIIMFCLCAYVVVSAPGNKIREQMFPENHQFFYSLALSASVFGKSLFAWILSPLLLVTALMFPVLRRLSQGISKKISFTINPLLTTLILLLSIYAMIFIPVWSIGKTPYSRTLNIIYFVFLIGWFYNIIAVISFYLQKGKLKYPRLPEFVNIILIIAILIFLVKRNNIRTAYSDLLRGTAINYDKEINARYNFIKNSKSDSIEVDAVKSIPRTIFVTDILSDGNDEFNVKFAEYFNKKFIVLKHTQTDSLKKNNLPLK